MKIELSASVYSVVTIKYEDTERLKAYLYDHTVVEDFPGYSIATAFEDHGKKIVPALLKTTVTVDCDPATIAAELNKARDRVLFLADYQLNRLASGMMQGTMVGTKQEAEMACVEVLT